MYLSLSELKERQRGIFLFEDQFQTLESDANEEFITASCVGPKCPISPWCQSRVKVFLSQYENFLLSAFSVEPQNLLQPSRFKLN